MTRQSLLEQRQEWRIPVSRPHIPFGTRELVEKCLQNVQLSHGPMVTEFEERFAEWLGVPYAVMCSSGTAGLHLALRAAGVDGDDGVIVPDLSFIATANACLYVGADVQMVDIEHTTWSLDLIAVHETTDEYTKAVIPVHLYGQCCDMDTLTAWATKHEIVVIEDAAEGLGGVFQGRKLGSIGHMGVFSFYGNKILATGEGGCVVCHDTVTRDALRRFRGQGQHPTERYYHPELGYNYRMTELQAAVGLAQLEELDQTIAVRREIFYEYAALLEGVQILHVRKDAAPWQFVVVMSDHEALERLQKMLWSHGIDHRPIFFPMHYQPLYFQPSDAFPVSSWLSTRGIVLPTYVGMTLANVREIVDCIKDSVEGSHVRGKEHSDSKRHGVVVPLPH